MSEDLSEGEKGDTVTELSAHGDSNRGRLPRINSVDAMEAWASQQKGKKLYIVLIRHELNFSSLMFECGRDEDYVVFSWCSSIHYNLLNKMVYRLVLSISDRSFLTIV